MRIERLTPREGYDLWANSYDATANPVVALDERVVPAAFGSLAGLRVVDAGCGTGRHLVRLVASAANVVGMDFSLGMLQVARQRCPAVPLVWADLQESWPLASGSFDLVVCALVGEHLERLTPVLAEAARVLVPGGRLVFSVYHPEMAASGIEAHFDRDGVEYRLGAVRHTTGDYRAALRTAGFTAVTATVFAGDDELARQIPRAAKFIGKPVLLLLDARA